jgi:CBS domain-containing protein
MNPRPHPRESAARLAAALALPALLAALAGGCAAPSLRLSPPDPLARPLPPAKETFRVVVLGDTQQMAPIDWFARGGPKERALVRARIEALAPDLVLHTGDIVGNGWSASNWAEFRREYASIPMWPVLGNHDLFGANEAALASYFETFPHVEGRRWYALRHPPLAFLMLDSNLGEMSEEEARAQTEWLSAELDRAQADAAVKGIVLVTHHPPLSTQIGGGDARIKEAFYEPAARRRGRWNQVAAVFSAEAARCLLRTYLLLEQVVRLRPPGADPAFAPSSHGEDRIMATIQPYYGRPAATVGEAASVAEAARIMSGRNIGALVVVDGQGEPVGFVGERELVQGALAQGRDAAATPVGEFTLRDVTSVSPREEASRCSQLMREHKTRHLLVREGGSVVGVVSMRDVIRAVLEEKESEVRQLQAYISGSPT